MGMSSSNEASTDTQVWPTSRNRCRFWHVLRAQQGAHLILASLTNLGGHPKRLVMDTEQVQLIHHAPDLLRAR